MLQITHDNFCLQHSYAIVALYICTCMAIFLEHLANTFFMASIQFELRLLLLCFMSILLVCLGPPSTLLLTPTTQVSH